MTDITQTGKLSPHLHAQVPEFVRLDHPTFVAFLTAYYEWLDRQGAYLRSPTVLGKVYDVDRTFEEYITQFKKQYLLDFPETLAVNSKTGRPVDPTTLIKNIKQFYRAKGTEKTYEFLFRILYDTAVEFYYPKVDILKASDGKWIQKKTLRIANATGKTINECIGRRVFQRNGRTVTAAANVLDISRFQLSSFEITELNLSNVNGSFVSSMPLYFETGNGESVEPKIYSCVTQITITSAGINYRVGDRLIFTNAANDIGHGAKAKVSQVSSTGKILKIKIENFGANYLTAPSITIDSENGTGFAGTASIGALCNYEGYYANNDGRLSTNKVIQDSHYYQNYSYVLKSEVVIDRYKEIIKRLIHPAGLGFFGQILIKRCIDSNLMAHTTLSAYEVPLIGHYLPYTLQTYDDLANWFNYGGQTQGYDPGTHDYLIWLANGNPITNSVSFVLGATGGIEKEVGFPRADPFWIVYHHPNTRIDHPVPVRISYDYKTEFCGATGSSADSWPEWTMTADDQRAAWAESFTGGYKYAVVEYDTSSAFGKITLASMLSMPIGYEYDCRYPDGIAATHANSPNFG